MNAVLTAVLQQSESIQFVQSLIYFTDKRASRARGDDVIGGFPAQWLRNFGAKGLRTITIERAQVDIHEAPTVFVTRFCTEAVHLIITARDREDVRTKDKCAEYLSLLEVRGDKDIRAEASLCGVRGDSEKSRTGRPS